MKQYCGKKDTTFLDGHRCAKSCLQKVHVFGNFNIQAVFQSQCHWSSHQICYRKSLTKIAVQIRGIVEYQYISTFWLPSQCQNRIFSYGIVGNFWYVFISSYWIKYTLFDMVIWFHCEYQSMASYMPQVRCAWMGQLRA